MKKKEKLQDALGMVGDDLIADAHTLSEKGKACKKRIFTRHKKATAALAAALALFILAGTLAHLFPGAPAQNFSPFALAYAAYPEDEKAPNRDDYKNDSEYFEAVSLWNKKQREELKNFHETGINIGGFTAATAPQMLAGSEGKNSLYSPLNIYILLAMLAETAGGESRGQILSLLGEQSIDALREKSSALWNEAYKDNGIARSLLSTSVWLSNKEEYKKEALQNLAKYYYSSAFSGEMGSEEYNSALRSWLNEGTDGLLADMIGDIELDADTFMALAATVYFSAPWDTAFEAAQTKTGIFRTPEGKREHEFMHSGGLMPYYGGESFGVVSKEFESGGQMCFILPNEGSTPEELLAKEDFLRFLCDSGSVSHKIKLVNFAVPKFDVSSEKSLCEDLKGLGVKDVFSDADADFTPITSSRIFVSNVMHGVRVRIDEKSCEAASYGIITMDATSAPVTEEIDFILDRPFIFLITTDAGTPLYIGIVNEP